MKALQPKGIRIRPSETAIGRIGKPMRSGKRQNFGIQTQAVRPQL